MHPLMLQQVIASCRERIAQGDCPTTPPFSVEQLEEAVAVLAKDREPLREPDDCDSCGGSGEAVIYHARGPYGEPEVIKCRDCEGTGLADPTIAGIFTPFTDAETVAGREATMEANAGVECAHGDNAAAEPVAQPTMDDGPRAEGDAKRMSNVVSGLALGDAAANAGMGGFSRSDDPTRPSQSRERLIHALTDALQQCRDTVHAAECPRGIANRIIAIADYAIDAAIESVAQQPPPIKCGPHCRDPGFCDFHKCCIVPSECDFEPKSANGQTWTECKICHAQEIGAAPQPEALTLADDLARDLRLLPIYRMLAREIAVWTERAAARIESDAERIRELEAEIAQRDYAQEIRAEISAERDYLQRELLKAESDLAASRERERAERGRADRLWQECENLRLRPRHS